MKTRINRRHFLGGSLVASSAAVMSYEESSLLAQQAVGAAPRTPASVGSSGEMPHGRLGRHSVSRLICGGNLISGFAHSRDLIYVSDLLRHYFTDERVFETFERCEERGINTAILRLDEHTLRILKRYRQERGGKMQWIAQVKIAEDDFRTEPQKAIDHGAMAIYVHGGVGDRFVAQGKTDQLGEVLELARRQGVDAGLAGHSIEVPRAIVAAGLEPDFLMKTFNSKQYWSAGPVPRHDSVWAETPEETKAFMARWSKPWIAYKVLGAGAIHPQEGFNYAFKHGADFICVGMFDFQVDENAILAGGAVAEAKRRQRPWCA